MTYIILNIAFMLAVIALLATIGLIRKKIPSKQWWYSLAFLLLLTAIFDNLIIFMDIVDYDPEKILGIKLLYAPIEDFMYTILSIIMIPALWTLFSNKERQDDK